MHEPAHDDRLRRLQRIAYGAVASDAERAAAVAELDALRREAVEAEAAAESGADAPVPVRERTPTGSMRAVSEWIAASDAASVRRFRWAVAAGTAALLVGIGVGWQLGARMAPSDAGAVDQALGASPSISLATPEGALSVVDSPAFAVFDRPPQATDTPSAGNDEWYEGWLDPTTLRLLTTTPDGVGVYGAKAVPGGLSSESGADDVCVVVVLADGSGGSCTQNGVFTEGRIWTEISLQGAGSVRAVWHADGTVQVTVPVG